VVDTAGRLRSKFLGSLVGAVLGDAVGSCWEGHHMAELFAENYFKEPWRGYGPGPPQVFRLLRNGETWDKAASLITHSHILGMERAALEEARAP